ncbi:helix-turn-helix domain-containing protein [Glycomyces algeriensis]|uniref:AraC family transcriptional regulator n=1 Tax=Glycomyces algeriensis TaxID=256037 RepID=A0A9W6G7Q4_9ACTN|nr:helix-turn-helix domain-containing protein [Glycomyces algeriensis]MDA1364913.1 helix-turn-helix domain-containing protein [Glycomyces algeriensis]MDR7350028.1 AraC-like DNA-binding protein [Glycomyces algeriensis]GLI42740.1 AraC family transcriptional regulator [Glycomyces algeriensis]
MKHEAVAAPAHAGIWVAHGAAPAMDGAHSHDDIEVNVVTRGAVEYLFGERRLRVEEGRTAVFWASLPHRLLAPEGEPAEVCWAHVPLSTVLTWDLPAAELRGLLEGRPALAAMPSDVDAQKVWRRWESDFAGPDADAALLELHALVRRTLRAARTPSGTGPASRPLGMAAYIMERFREPITTADVAAVVHLNTEYAMTLFRKAWHMTMGDFLLRRRVAEAQRLLATTDLDCSAVGYAAGFGSGSNFYAQFAKLVGTSPGQYRAALRAGSAPD